MLIFSPLNYLGKEGLSMVVIKSKAEQNRMSPKGQRRIKYLFYTIVVLMLVLVYVFSKYNIKNVEVWVSISNATCVGFLYLLAIYYQYVTFPEKQKKLKAIIDAFANLLALIAIVLTFISVVITGKASSLYAELAGSNGESILFGLIIGVLLSRVLFPFWDIYSSYRKV